jgi:hypothetical protein
MIAAVSPCASSSDHTLNTLRYADRVKEKRVSADAFDERHADSDAVGVEDVQFEEGAYGKDRRVLLSKAPVFNLAFVVALDLDGDEAYRAQDGGEDGDEYDDEEEYQPGEEENEDEYMREDDGEKCRSLADDSGNDVVTISSHHTRGGPDLSDDLSVLRISHRRHSSTFSVTVLSVLYDMISPTLLLRQKKR